jgi:photosystem II stability/assembly factor-like uncharacterized protein
MRGADFSKLAEAKKRRAEIAAQNPSPKNPAVVREAPAPEPETAPALLAADFWDEKRGLVVGQRGVILLSEDNGQTWTRVNSEIGTDLSCVACFQTDLAAAAGRDGVVVMTENGGKSWHPQPLSEPKALHFVSWVLPGPQLWTGGSDGLCFTWKKGDAWQRVSTDVLEFLYSADFLNNKEGWVSCTQGVLLKTTDGGAAWQRVEVPTRSDLCAVDFMDSKVGAVGGLGGVVMTTQDGGQTWSSGGALLCHIYDVGFGPGGSLMAAGEGCLMIRKSPTDNWEDLPPPSGFQILGARIQPGGQNIFVMGKELAINIVSVADKSWTPAQVKYR